jgi:2-dehydro-3-deoxygluconokinase
MGEAEARTVLGLTGPADALVEALARLAPAATIAVLQGSEGSTVLADGRLWRPTRSHPVQVIDPVGAGDAYVAGFLWAILQGRGPQAAVDAGAAVAALKCSTWGDVALVDVRDVGDLLAGGSDIRR